MTKVFKVNVYSINGMNIDIRKSADFSFKITGGTNVSLSMIVNERVVKYVHIGDALELNEKNISYK